MDQKLKYKVILISLLAGFAGAALFALLNYFIAGNLSRLPFNFKNPTPPARLPADDPRNFTPNSGGN